MKKATEHFAVSIIIPVYKSAGTLQELHTRIGEVAKKGNLTIEIIYVNDASPDHSPEVLLDLPSFPAHSVYCLKTNHGQSSALLSGIVHARYELFATLDADLQDEPEALPHLVSELSHDKDVIFATRSGKYERISRHITSFIFKSLITLFSGGRIPPNAGLFLVGRKSKFLPVLRHLPQKPYLIGLIARFRLECQSLQVVRKKNPYGESSYTFLKRVRVAQSFFRTFFLNKPRSETNQEQWISENVVEKKRIDPEFQN